ncbi:MAG: GNAT family N-acetyltransferase [Anaerolineae bacterium]|nr:GNAT family N-acetyltransferase [Anaerolineae bacterium]
MTVFSVRRYEPDDRADLHRIAAETAFFGRPVEAFLDDRRLYCDAFYAYYTDLEGEYGWVACVEGQVVGFLVGCANSKRQMRRWLCRVLPGVAWRALRGRYRLGRKTWAFTARVALSTLRGEFASADLDRYPAHLHINVAAEYRGRGVGRRLMDAYLEQLRRGGVPGVHLHTTSLNEAACRLYEGAGFRVVDACPTGLWTHLVDRAVEYRCYALALAPGGDV